MEALERSLQGVVGGVTVGGGLGGAGYALSGTVNTVRDAQEDPGLGGADDSGLGAPAETEYQADAEAAAVQAAIPVDGGVTPEAARAYAEKVIAEIDPKVLAVGQAAIKRTNVEKEALAAEAEAITSRTVTPPPPPPPTYVDENTGQTSFIPPDAPASTGVIGLRQPPRTTGAQVAPAEQVAAAPTDVQEMTSTGEYRPIESAEQTSIFPEAPAAEAITEGASQVSLYPQAEPVRKVTAPRGTPQRAVEEAQAAMEFFENERKVLSTPQKEVEGAPGPKFKLSPEAPGQADAMWMSMLDAYKQLTARGFETAALRDALHKATGQTDKEFITSTSSEDTLPYGGKPISGRGALPSSDSNAVPPGGWLKVIDDAYAEIGKALTDIETQPADVLKAAADVEQTKKSEKQKAIQAKITADKQAAADAKKPSWKREGWASYQAYRLAGKEEVSKADILAAGGKLNADGVRLVLKRKNAPESTEIQKSATSGDAAQGVDVAAEASVEDTLAEEATKEVLPSAEEVKIKRAKQEGFLSPKDLKETLKIVKALKEHARTTANPPRVLLDQIAAGEAQLKAHYEFTQRSEAKKEAQEADAAQQAEEIKAAAEKAASASTRVIKKKPRRRAAPAIVDEAAEDALQSERSIRRQEGGRKTQDRVKTIDKRDDLLTMIARLGGISRSEIAERTNISGETLQMKGRKSDDSIEYTGSGQYAVFSTSGIDVDGMVSLLEGAGIVFKEMSEDSKTNSKEEQLLDWIRDELLLSEQDRRPALADVAGEVTEAQIEAYADKYGTADTTDEVVEETITGADIPKDDPNDLDDGFEFIEETYQEDLFGGAYHRQDVLDARSAASEALANEVLERSKSEPDNWPDLDHLAYDHNATDTEFESAEFISADDLINATLPLLHKDDPLFHAYTLLKKHGVSDVRVFIGRSDKPMNAVGQAGHHRSGTRVVMLSPDAIHDFDNTNFQATYVLAHELVHSATLSALTTDNVFAKEILAIYQQAESHAKKASVKDAIKDPYYKGRKKKIRAWNIRETEEATRAEIGGVLNVLSGHSHYGFKTLAEFIAEAHTNLKFQQLLASIPVKQTIRTAVLSKPSRRSRRPQNLWEKLTRAVAKYFRGGTESTYVENNALDAVMALSPGVFINASKMDANTQLNAYLESLNKHSLVRASFKTILGVEELGQIDESWADMAQTPQPPGPRRNAVNRMATAAGEGGKNIVNAAFNAVLGPSGTEFARKGARSTLALSAVDQIIRNHKHKFQVGDRNLLDIYHNAIRHKTQIARRLQLTAEKIQNAWSELERTNILGATDTASLMRDATLSEMHPDLAWSNPKHDHLRQRAKNASDLQALQDKHKELRDRFNALPTAGRALYRSVRDFHVKERNDFRRAALTRIADTWDVKNVMGVADYNKIISATDASVLDTLDFSKFPKGGARVRSAIKEVTSLTSVLGPYFRLARFGKYVVEGFKPPTRVGKVHVKQADARAAARALEANDPTIKVSTLTDKNAAKGVPRYYNEVSERIVEMHDDKATADKAARRLIKQGYSRDPNTAGVPVEATLKRDFRAPPSANLHMLLGQAKDKFDPDSPEARALDTVFLQLLAENSARKPQLHREKVDGVQATQMRRGFAQQANAGSWAQAEIQTSLEVSAARKEMQEHADKGDVPMQEVVQELRLQDDPNISEASITSAESFLSQAGFLWYLGSPSYAMVNATQVHLVGTPYLAAKYGIKALPAVHRSYDKVLKAAATELIAVKGGLTGKSSENTLDRIKNELSADEQVMLDSLLELGILDATFAQELYRASKTEGSTNLGKGMNLTLNVARTLPQTVELVNRVVMARAAYALELQKNGGDKQGAITAAAEAIYQTQFDYSNANKPRWFKYSGEASKTHLSRVSTNPLHCGRDTRWLVYGAVTMAVSHWTVDDG
jgi:hypothetical protein